MAIFMFAGSHAAVKYQDGKYYHVYNRGANKQEIFWTRGDFNLCLYLIRKYVPQYRVSVAGYCLMPNHYHLLLRQDEGGSISRFIQTMVNAYTQSINLATGHSGTLFQGRAKGVEITDDNYAVRLARYIHYNPVDAGLVAKPEAWEFSDYPVWAGIRERGLSDFSLRDTCYDEPRKCKSLKDGYVGEKELPEIFE